MAIVVFGECVACGKKFPPASRDETRCPTCVEEGRFLLTCHCGRSFVGLKYQDKECPTCRAAKAESVEKPAAAEPRFADVQGPHRVALEATLTQARKKREQAEAECQKVSAEYKTAKAELSDLEKAVTRPTTFEGVREAIERLEHGERRVKILLQVTNNLVFGPVQFARRQEEAATRALKDPARPRSRRGIPEPPPPPDGALTGSEAMERHLAAANPNYIPGSSRSG